MLLFVDQSGQLGGAELCLADIASTFGAEGRVLLLAEGPFAELLRRRGVTVKTMPLPSAAGRLTKKASPVDFARALPATAAYTLSLRKEFRQCDALYLNTAKALLYGMAAGAGLRKPGICHLHDLWDRAHFTATNIRLLVAAANRSSAVIANSRATAEAFQAAGGRVPCHVIPNGFESASFQPIPPADVAALRQQFNPEGNPVAAVFGRLARWKGQDVLIRAALALPDLTVWIVGEALFTDEDRAYAEELKNLAASAGARIRFLGFRDDVPQLMQAADIVVHTSVAAEPFGRVLVEGMLSGKPVIASAAGGPREIIEDKVTGLLVPPGDESALGHALKQLLTFPALRQEMGLAGRAHAERTYALPTILAKTREVIASVLS